MTSAAPRRRYWMTRPTDDLRDDHALVATGLRVLTAIGGHVRRGGLFPAEDTATALRFLREFLLATHFRKENEVVWPALAMRDDGEAALAVGELMLAQEEATELIATLVVFWEPAGELTEAERLGFADTIDALEQRLQRMQATEEQLFVACDRGVPADDQLDWPHQFSTVEASRSSRAQWAGPLRRLADDWVA